VIVLLVLPPVQDVLDVRMRVQPMLESDKAPYVKLPPAVPICNCAVGAEDVFDPVIADE
jgi:hypothetical protein